MCCLSRLFLSCSLLLASSEIASALPLGMPTQQIVAQECPAQNFISTINGPGTLNGTVSCQAGTAVEIAILSEWPSPYLYASTSGTSTGIGDINYGIGDASTLAYSAQVVGSGTDLVPVTFASRGAANSTGLGIADALLSISYGGISLYNIQACSDSYQPAACGGYTSQFDVSPTFYLTPGQPVNIYLGIGTELVNVPGSGTARAYIDPYIFIDPSFANANQYSIEVSQGVGNSPFVAATPEPTTFVLLATGSALCWIRRKTDGLK